MTRNLLVRWEGLGTWGPGVSPWQDTGLHRPLSPSSHFEAVLVKAIWGACEDRSRSGRLLGTSTVEATRVATSTGPPGRVGCGPLHRAVHTTTAQTALLCRTPL